MASLRRKYADAAPLADAAPSSVSSPEIPLPGAAGDFEGVISLKAQMQSLKRAQDSLHGEPDAVPTIEDKRRQWLSANADARSQYAHLGELHRQALTSGLTDMSPAYVDFMNEQVATLAAQTPAAAANRLAAEMRGLAARETREPRRAEPEPQHFVSAPVSREPPSSYYGGHRSGQIRLTPDQREAARIAGITEVEYARELERFLIAKANGDYTGKP